jgi:glycerophosphoryl diester phosphodiesterase
MRRKSLASWITERPFAHRGLHDLAAGIPENSLAAFEAAIANQYAIELDVQQLGDGSLVVFHDDDLLRATGDRRSLLQVNRAEMDRFRLFETDHRASCLVDVLAAIDGRVPILLEIKHRGRGTGIAASVSQAIAGYRGPLAVQSFNPFVVAWFRQHTRGVALGQLAGPLLDDPLVPFDKFASRHLFTLGVSRPDFINYDLRALPNAWISLVARLSGLPLLCWTVHDRSEQARAIELGANYVFEGILP